MNFLKHGQDSHGVHRGYQATEQEEVQQPDVQVSWEERGVLGQVPLPPLATRTERGGTAGSRDQSTGAGPVTTRLGTLPIVGLRLASVGAWVTLLASLPWSPQSFEKGREPQPSTGGSL